MHACAARSRARGRVSLLQQTRQPVLLHAYISSHKRHGSLAYQEPMDKGGNWIFNKQRIAVNYMKGWFMIDFLSVLPFWTLTLDYQSPDLWFPNFAQMPSVNATDAVLGGSGAQTATISRGAVLLRSLR